MNAQARSFEAAAVLIAQSDGLIITAGAGMGVDSGLPDFRGDTGFWKSYPALRKSGVAFADIASPSHFWTDPRLAWGFYGHRLALYRNCQPHAGFQLLQEIAWHLTYNAFVYTSNVDGHFQKAGFSQEQICECHGSIHYLQCLSGCRNQVWLADDFVPIVDEKKCQLITSRQHAHFAGDWRAPTS